MAKKSVAIVGAGIGGLTAAAILAPHANVTVFERSDEVGGKIRQTALGNDAIDCGPTVFTLKSIFERIFRLCGEELEEHVTLTPLPVLARHAWPDGSHLDLYADVDQSADAIAEFAGTSEAAAYRRFLEVAERNWRTLYRPMIEQPEADFKKLLTSTPPHLLIRLNPYISLWQELSRRFKDKRLRQLFARYTTYCGSSPFDAPAVMSMIAHIEQQGVWALEGGMRSLARALCNIAQKRGAVVKCGVEVEALDTQDGRLRGVVGADDQAFTAVVFNGDVAALERGRLANGVEDRSDDRQDRSLSAVTLCFTGYAEGLDPSMHNVFFDFEYREEFEAIFKRRSVPDTPTVYLFAPDHHQTSDQPQRFFCLINAPPNGDEKSYTEVEQHQCRTKVLEHLERCGLKLTTSEDSIVTTTPTDFATRFPATGGSLYGRPIHGWRASFQRPGIRTRTKGVYCAGGSVHPGSGVPMAALSGMMAAQAVMKDFALI